MDRTTPIGQLTYLIDLWDVVCDEQERNHYDWKSTRAKVLSGWPQENLDADFFSAYMTAAIISAARDLIKEKNND